MIRSATADDVDVVVALVESAYRGDSSRAGWTTEADLLAGRRTGPDEVAELVPHLLLAEQDSDVVGCCTMVPKDNRGYFGMFAVRPGLQGGGVGAALLAAAEDRARALGLPAVEMTVLRQRSELIAFYLRRGYADTGEERPFPYGDERFGRPNRSDLSFVVLEKVLSG
jgi:N-acetylglutamate synthase-like GNAT family acetyltransferase